MERKDTTHGNNQAPPPPPLVKVCGLNTEEAAIRASEAGADLLGLIFVKKSKRYVTVKGARDICRAVDKWINEKALKKPTLPKPPTKDDEEVKSASTWFKDAAKELLLQLRPEGGSSRVVAPLKVGVFMNHTAEQINTIVEEVGLDLIQLHGKEPKDIPTKLNRAAIRVVHVDGDSTISSLKENVTPGFAPYLMLDSKGGGTGKTFDWKLASKFGDEYPFFLAGGLDPENVESAIKAAKPMGVDVCGGVEKSKGIKDLEKISKFVGTAKKSST